MPLKSLEADAVAKLLVEIGQRLALAGESPYKARAYTRAAESLLTLTVPLSEVIAQGRLREIPGVGSALAATIEELHNSGSTRKLDRLRTEVPAAVLEMLRIPRVSPDKVALIRKRLGVGTLSELEQACRADRIATTKGLG